MVIFSMQNFDLPYLTKVCGCTLACSALAATLVYVTFDLMVGFHLLSMHVF